MRASKLLLIALASASLAVAPLIAQTTTLIVPDALRDGTTEGVAGTSWPWNLGATSAARLQYLYDSSHFANGGAVTGPIAIRGLRWRAEGGATLPSSAMAGGPAGTYTDVAIRVGAAGVDHRAAAPDYAQNWAGGVVPAPAYRGTVEVQAASGGSPNDFHIAVAFSPVVIYDPTSGDDLIVEIAHDGGFSGATVLSDAVAGPQDPRTTRVWSIVARDAARGSVQRDVGLCCEIEYTAATGLYADFRFAPARVGVGESVQFTDRSFSSAPGGVVSWAWDFDSDGTVDDTAQNPTTTFAVCGAGQVTLTITDAMSATTSVTLPGPEIVAPTANFAFVSGIAPITIPFTDRSTGGSTRWAWDFDGDGVVDSTLQSPSWSFATEDVFDVALTVTSACGSDTLTRQVDTRSVLSSTFAGGLSLVASDDGAGNMFDLDVRPAAGVTVTRLLGNFDISGVTGTATVDTEVWVVPGGYVGREIDRSLWTLVGRGRGAPIVAGPETDLAVNPFCLQQGVWGVYVFCESTAGDLEYSRIDPARPVYENLDLRLIPGVAQPTPFRNTIPDRAWNGCIDYAIGASRPGQVLAIGGGCAGSNGMTPQLRSSAGQLPTAGRDLTLEVAQAPPSTALSAVVFGFASFPNGGVDLGIIGMPGCSLWFEGAIALPAPTDASGLARLLLSVGPDRTSVGLRFYAQALIADAAANQFGVIVSNASRFVVGCP